MRIPGDETIEELDKRAKLLGTAAKAFLWIGTRWWVPGRVRAEARRAAGHALTMHANAVVEAAMWRALAKAEAAEGGRN